MKKGLLAVTVLMVALLVFNACKKTNTDTPGNGGNNGFDKTAMLNYYADDIIIPGYAELNTKVTALEDAVNNFATTSNTANLSAAQAAYKEAHLQYVRVAPFQFGPAETALLDQYLNFSGGLDYNFNTSGTLTGFSIDTATIENNIKTGTYDFSAMTRNSFYSQGFPALNYLLFGPDALGKLTASVNRVKYTKGVVSRMKVLVAKVNSEWTGYRATFTSNTKTNVGSPIGNMINQMAYQLDILKGPRIGWPFGRQSNNIVFADKTEAYYAGISVALAVESLTALQKMYTANGSGKGLSNYVVSLNNAQLNTDVLAQFDIAITKLKAIPDPLSSSLTTQAPAIDAAYREIQKLLTLIKTDLASATAVQITFMDNDGD